MLKPLFVSFRTTNTRYRITMKNQGKKWTIEVYYSRGIKATADTGSYGMDGLNLPWTNRIKLWTMDIRRELYWDFSMIGWMNFDFIFGKNKEAYLGFFFRFSCQGVKWGHSGPKVGCFYFIFWKCTIKSIRS